MKPNAVFKCVSILYSLFFECQQYVYKLVLRICPHTPVRLTGKE